MKFQIKRLISQLSLLITANLGAFGFKTGFCYPFFYCNACPAADAACPIRAIEKSVFQGSFAWKLFIYPFAILGTVGVISGRAVCGWGCPIGFLQRSTSPVSRKLRKYSLINKIGQHKIEPYLRYLKYVSVIGLAIITPYLIGFMFTDICPVGFLTGTIPISILNLGGYAPTSYFYPALVIFILFIILIFTVERGWCRYFCPVGAILAPFNKISFLHIKVNLEGCTHCHACSKICPMGIDVPTMNRSPECILCGKCIDQCPQSAISYEGFK